ncbi:MAG: hypothetical protein ABI183_12880 [Polyangiaceae bacterium]
MHDKAGPLHPSRELLELLRLQRALGKTFGEATLDVSVVHAIETELGATLPDDALIIMALRDRDLSCATGLKVDSILDIAEDCEDDAPDDHVAIAQLDHEPFAARDEGVHGGALQVMSIARPGDAASPKIMVDGFEDTIAGFARDKITVWLRHNDNWLQVLSHEKDLPLEDESFKPALTGLVVTKPAKPERKVAHPKFGRGLVVEEKSDAGDLKLVIDFENAGRKTLLAKFVTDA